MSDTPVIMTPEEELAEAIRQDEEFYAELAANPNTAWMVSVVEGMIETMVGTSESPEDELVINGFTGLFEAREEAGETILVLAGKRGEDGNAYPFLMLRRIVHEGSPTESVQWSNDEVCNRMIDYCERWLQAQGEAQPLVQAAAPAFALVWLDTIGGRVIGCHIPSDPADPEIPFVSYAFNEGSEIHYQLSFRLDTIVAKPTH